MLLATLVIIIKKQVYRYVANFLPLIPSAGDRLTGGRCMLPIAQAIVWLPPPKLLAFKSSPFTLKIDYTSAPLCPRLRLELFHNIHRIVYEITTFTF